VVKIETEVEEFLIREVVPGLRALDHTAEVDLLDEAGIDSLGIVQLISFLEESYGIKVDDADLDPANFRTLPNIVEFVERKRG
jgi:acyl carrier protein